jgi:hypothetical protein
MHSPRAAPIRKQVTNSSQLSSTDAAEAAAHARRNEFSTVENLMAASHEPFSMPERA